MNNQAELIDHIVDEVLRRLGTAAETVRANGADHQTARTILTDRVVTADVLQEKTNGAAAIVVVGQKAVVTPSAWDLARSRNLTIQRENAAKLGNEHAAASESVRLIVVNSTSAVDRVLGESRNAATTTDCPDDAAEMAAEAVRERKEPVAVFAAWSHRVAMLANRHDKVRAAVIESASQVRPVAKQMRPNVWCVDPRPLSYFELKNLISTIQKS
jgi:hypothetical protein